MRKDFGAKTWLYPMPVLIIASYDKNGTVDAMNAAWGGIGDYEQISMCLSKGHKTVKNILERKAFTVSVATAKYVKECDYLGLVSANDNPNKFAKTGFTVTHSARVNAPVINELPFAIECELIDYDSETGTMRGRIVNVSADESVLTDGKIDVQKLAPITFDSANNAYVVLGQTVGKAFKDGLSIK